MTAQLDFRIEHTYRKIMTMNNLKIYILFLALFYFSPVVLSQSNFDYFKNRTINGTFNDLRNNDEGKAGVPFLRIGKAHYDSDGWTMIEGPNAREVSNLVCDKLGDEENKYGLSSLVFTFLQFLDHDITQTAEGGEFTPIIVPQGDPQFDPMHTGSVIIPFTRSGYEEGTGQNASNPRQQRNLITAWLDASVVYGSDENRAHWLRTGECGRLKVSKSSFGDLLPCNTIDGSCNTLLDENAPSMAMDRDHSGKLRKMFVAGDVRANEQPGLTALHTLFVREHNRICNELENNGFCDDERNYQYARKVVGGIIQSITYNELIPILGLKIGSDSYRRNMSPEIFNSFATSAYRLGHTMISEFIPIIEDECGDVSDELSLAEAFFNPSIIQNIGIEGILKGLHVQVQQEVDPGLVPAVRNFLFGPPGAGGLDLAALNIQRGRDHGLPDYNTLRAEFGLSKIKRFSQISSDPDIQHKLEKAYSNVDHIDSWIGMLCEDHISSSPFGKTIMTILSAQFRNIRKADRLYYSRDRSLSRNVRFEISRTTLADVIKRNTEVHSMSKAFYKEECQGGEEIVYCGMQARIFNYEWIASVGVNGKVNESMGQNYSDFTDVVFPLTKGENKIELISGYKFLPFTKMWNVWIDLNRNGVFEEDELRLSTISKKPIESAIKIPSNASKGETRMRVIMSLFRTKDPCVDIHFGEVEDYTVSIGDSPAGFASLAKRGTRKNIAQHLQVYPNPAFENIAFNGIDFGTNDQRYVIMNGLGQAIIAGNTSELSNGLQISHWKSGVYFMNVQSNSEASSKSVKFIVR